MAQANITLTLDDAYVPAFRAYLLANHPEADTTGDGNVTGPEIIAWLNGKSQDMLLTFASRAVTWAEENDLDSLPQTHRDALAAKQTADSALATERAKIAP